jgi:signal peptidase I
MNKSIGLLLIATVSLFAQENNNNQIITASDVLQALHATYSLQPYKTVCKEYSTSPIKYKNNKYKPASPPVAAPIAKQDKDCSNQSVAVAPQNIPAKQPNINNKPDTELFSVVGNSMLPTLSPSASVVVDKNVCFEDVKQGDIIVYKTTLNSRRNKITPYVVHRVYSKQQDKIICKGDNNPVIDREYITSSNLIGRVISMNQSLVGN